MKENIENYTIYKKENEIIFEIAAQQVDGFNFLKTSAYISSKRIKQGVFFVSDKEKENILTFKSMSEKDLKKLQRQKSIIIALINADKSYEKIYEFDLIKIK